MLPNKIFSENNQNSERIILWGVLYIEAVITCKHNFKAMYAQKNVIQLWVSLNSSYQRKTV